MSDVRHPVHRLLQLHTPRALACHARLRARPPAGLFFIAAAIDADVTLREVQEAAEELPHAPRVVWPRTTDELVSLLRTAMRHVRTKKHSGDGVDVDGSPPPPPSPLTIFEYGLAASAPVHALLCAALADRCLLAVVVDEHGPSAALGMHLRAQRVRRAPPTTAKPADWTALGGMGDVKRRLRVALEWPRQHGAALRRLGVRPSRGVLLHGPPGCGKTSLVRAVAAAGAAHFESLTPADVYSCFVGDAERRVRAAFALARARAPAILFLDEIDAIAGSRTAAAASGGGGVDVGQRVLATLLTEMDGVVSASGVTVVAATNRIDAVDPALKRPGRFDDLIHVPLPDVEDRKHILALWMDKVAVADDADLDWLVHSTEGRSPAEILGLCNEAAMAAARDYWSKDEMLEKEKPCVRRADFAWALKSCAMD